MTRASTPLWVIYGGHCPPWLRVGQSFPRIGTPMTVAGTSMPRAPRRLRLGRFSPRNRPRSVPLAPRQGDLRHVDIATVKDTLGPVHWDVDNCPVAMELNEPAAVEGP